MVFFATVLLLLSFWVIRRNSTKPTDSLMIHNVIITTELENRLRLTGTLSRFPYGSRQVFLHFDYSRAAKGSEFRILWFIGDQLVQADTYALDVSSGSKIYCLLRENGQILPRGFYSISILNNSERLSDFRFEIY
ncbi:MAG: hypothetical protein LBJ36_04090 [Synergistaceae bacterium]|nr:hypothetical protein [Synergistaceae bacterium]